MIRLIEGALLKQNEVGAVVNAVNCVGVMGKGIALQFKNKWPANFAQYAAACKAGEVRPGQMFVYDAGQLVRPRITSSTFRQRSTGGEHQSSNSFAMA